MDTTETVTGEKRFNSDNVKFESPKFPLLPTGDYELKILGNTVRTEPPSQSNDEGLPYLSVRMEAVGGVGETTYETPASGKNVLIFPRFFLRTTPTAKGFVAVDARNSITGLAKSLGDTLDVLVITHTTQKGTDIEMLDANAVIAWLKSKDGMVVKAHVKQRKGGTYVKKDGTEGETKDANEIAYFIL